MDKTTMLNALISQFGGGKKGLFAEHIGVSPQAISSWLSRNTFDAELIYAKCVGVSAAWLLSGKGEMLTSPKSNTYTIIEEIPRVVCQPVAEYQASSNNSTVTNDSAVSLALIQQISAMQSTIMTQSEEIGRLKAENEILREENSRYVLCEKGGYAIDHIADTA